MASSGSAWSTPRLTTDAMTLVAAPSRAIPAETAEDARARALALGVSRGDRDAVAAFYEAWFDRTLAAATRACGRDESFCLDVVQEVMIKVAGRMPPLATHAEVERWMWRVTYHAALDALRGEKRRRDREQSRASGGAGHERDDARLEWLRGELARLSSEERLLVRARFAGAMTLREIGVGLGHTTGAVHGRLRTTVERLKRRSEEESNEQ